MWFPPELLIFLIFLFAFIFVTAEKLILLQINVVFIKWFMTFVDIFLIQIYLTGLNVFDWYTAHF